jgi:branched-chain amino acid transport system substrate-binding protein
MLALSVGLIGCGGEQIREYSLTISSTEGGSVTTPGEETFTYDEGEVVNLTAEADEGYHFVNWTDDVDTIADVEDATTTITLNGDYSITANFEETPAITFAVAGPMTEFQGKHQWWGAEMARDEINAGPGIKLGGVYHKVELVQVETNEILGTPEEGVDALEAVIDDVDFVMGGANEENVVVYRGVAMDAQKIFMGCGPVGASLQYSVVDDYDTYKYWFKTTPLNEIFLFKSLLKMTVTIGGLFKDALVAMGTDVKDDYEVGEADRLRVAIISEDRRWAELLMDIAELYLPFLGFDVVGTWRLSATATDISTELTAIAAERPHIIFTLFTGPIGLTYSRQRAELGIPAMTLGINREGWSTGAWAATNQGCNYDIVLDTWAEGLQNTASTAAFFDAFVAKTGEYPVCTAGTYDVIYSLKEAIEGVSAAHGWDDIADVVDPANIDALIQHLETSAYTGIYGKYAYYPMPAIDLGDGVYALSEPQVRALYPSLATYDQANWLCAASGGPHIAHDIVYGPGYVTGIASQWQDGHKVGIWPIDFGDEYDEALTDQYGCWNFEYPGTVDVVIPIEEFLAS